MNLVKNTICEGCDKRAELEDEKSDLEGKLEEMTESNDYWRAECLEAKETLDEIREPI